MKSAPCGGCPPCCNLCVFEKIPQRPANPHVTTVAAKANYGCIRRDGGDVVLAGGRLGMMRGDYFHPISVEGVAFLHSNGNPLGNYC